METSSTVERQAPNKMRPFSPAHADFLQQSALAVAERPRAAAPTRKSLLLIVFCIVMYLAFFQAM